MISKDAKFPFKIVMEGVLTLQGHVRWSRAVEQWGLGEVTYTWAPGVALPVETLLSGLESQGALIASVVMRTIEWIEQQEGQDGEGTDPGAT